jgi:hypothetical protein
MQIVELQEYIMNLDFDNVWDFMNKYVLSEDKQESVLIPEIEEWHEIKNLLINKKKVSRSDYRKFSSITASLPPSIKVDERPKSARFAAYDRDHQRQSKQTSTHE